MANITKDSPFTPGSGRFPPELAGRGEETAVLGRMLERLDGERVEGKLKIAAYDTVKIIGPRGAGKTALLQWARQEAERLDILVVNCACLEGDVNVDPMRQVLAAMEQGPPELVKLLRESGLTAPAASGGVQIRPDLPYGGYLAVVSAILEKKPLLLLLDEAQRFDPRPLGQMLRYNQRLICDGCPLGVVIAGPPKLFRVVIATEARFMDFCRQIRINTLSDEAARDALRVPFARAGLGLAPEALELMAEQADNYPALIQLLGDVVWNEMARLGRREAEADLVREIEPLARERREEAYEKARARMRKAGVLPQVLRITGMIDKNGGQIAEEWILDALTENEGMDHKQAWTIYEGLREDGVIWAEHGLTTPCIRSFFNYFKQRDRIENPPKGMFLQLRGWLQRPFEHGKRG